MNRAVLPSRTLAGSGRHPSAERCPHRRGARGQATVEIALLLPLIAVLALAVGQVAVVAHDRVMLTHSAREGVRVAAVGGSDAEVRAEVIAASRLPPERVAVAVQRDATTVEVTVSHRAVTDLPLVGALVDDLAMVAVARMQREESP